MFTFSTLNIKITEVNICQNGVKQMEIELYFLWHMDTITYFSTSSIFTRCSNFDFIPIFFYKWKKKGRAQKPMVRIKNALGCRLLVIFISNILMWMTQTMKKNPRCHPLNSTVNMTFMHIIACTEWMKDDWKCGNILKMIKQAEAKSSLPTFLVRYIFRELQFLQSLL